MATHSSDQINRQYKDKIFKFDEKLVITSDDSPTLIKLQLKLKQVNTWF